MGIHTAGKTVSMPKRGQLLLGSDRSARSIDAAGSARSPNSHMDALLWLFISAALLSIIPIGFISGDGLVQSIRYARGDWAWDPNALLFEPVGAWWQTTLTSLGMARLGIDQLKLLTVISGAISVGLFRWSIAGRIARRRIEANHATAWFALGSAFSRMWITEEAYMLQMPFLVVTGISIHYYVHHRSFYRAVLVGVSAALAAFFFISNLILAAALGVVLGVWHAFRREWRQGVLAFAGVAIGSTGVAALGFGIAWLALSRPDASFLDWVTSYKGGSSAGDSFYAVRAAATSLRGYAVSGARALYGSGSALVDVAPVVEVVRDGLRVTFRTVLNVLAFAAASVLMVAALIRVLRVRANPNHQVVLLLVASWTTAILLFMLYWDNSDPQFFFQFAVPIGALIATLPLTWRGWNRALIALSVFALSWNAVDLFTSYIFYPREERMAQLRTGLQGADMIIHPGRDEVGRLLYVAGGDLKEKRAEIGGFVQRYPSSEGLLLLQDSIRHVLARGGRVDIVEVYDVPPQQHPWKSYRQVGYYRDAVLDALNQFPVDPETRWLGPFTVRSIHPAGRTQ